MTQSVTPESPLLYLHCGYHKTGSSYLQSLLAANADLLRAAGIWYPATRSHAAASRGQVTSGNGSAFSLAIREGSQRRAESLLAGYAREARTKGCNAILLSNEGLFHSLSRVPAFPLLGAVTEAVGIGSVHGLVFVRPVDEHALSTYTHRLPTALVGPLDHWVVRDYETWRLMETFLDGLEASSAQFEFRSYAAQRHRLGSALFEDWLGINEPRQVPKGTVNDSLTLSEALVVAALERGAPGLGEFLKSELLAVSGAVRGKDESARASALAVIRHVAGGFDPIIGRLNALMPPGEVLPRPHEQPAERPGDVVPAQLNSAQLSALTRGVERYVREATSLGHVVKSRIPAPIRAMLQRGRRHSWFR